MAFLLLFLRKAISTVAWIIVGWMFIRLTDKIFDRLWDRSLRRKIRKNKSTSVKAKTKAL